ncbi:hypothetical protein [Pseudonocardia xishanensis]|uniref:Uncharacterized protein n=1 Tax=Pseudonocardia xishanensis TaxID=630995 RepID=A0ABP8S2E8_9PSEU
MSPRTTPPDRSPAETTTYLAIPPAPDDRDPSESEGRAAGPVREARNPAPAPTDAGGEQAAGERAAGEQTLGEQTAGEQTLGEQTLGEQTLGEQTLGEQTAVEHTAARPTEEATTAAQRTEADPAAGERTTADAPGADASAEEPDPGPSTAVLEPLEIPPAPATIPALPLAPRDPADRPFAEPRRSTPGKPDARWRRLFRRARR